MKRLINTKNYKWIDIINHIIVFSLTLTSLITLLKPVLKINRTVIFLTVSHQFTCS